MLSDLKIAQGNKRMDKKIYKDQRMLDKLYDKRNICLALYSADSYIINRELLEKEENEKLIHLKDFFDQKNLNAWIKIIEQRLRELMEEDAYLKADVYFKPKKYEDDKVIFRPLHHSNLVDQITAVSLLNVLIYDFDCDNKVGMSNLSRLIPHNFYGNRVAYEAENLFIPWQKQYKKYTTKANDAYKRYHDTHEYKWEISLDLTNFFPSINPVVLFNYIDEKLPVNLSHDDRKTVRKILEKLIFVEIQELSEEDKKRYFSMSAGGDRFASGIAQGLPQSYFLANLLMIKIQEFYKEILPGEMYFYVDDSVIFTNAIDEERELEEKINELNNKIEEWVNSSFDKTDNVLPQALIEYTKARRDEYKIEIHKPGEKSTASNVIDSNESEIYLHCLGRETSKTAFEMNTSYSDEENTILLNKTEKLLEAINEELDSIKDNEAYKKKLVRYKKFFKYRMLDLRLRTQKDSSELLKKLMIDLDKIVGLQREKGLKIFFDNYTEDVLGPLINMVLSEMSNSGTDNSEVVEKIKKLNVILFDTENTETSYIYRAFSRYWQNDDESQNLLLCNRYASLSKELIGNERNNSKKANEIRWEKAKEELEFAKKDDILVQKINEEYAYIVQLIDANSYELRRMVLNAYISSSLGIEISDEIYLYKKGNRKITYAELRILEMLRLKRFDLQTFRQLIENFMEDEYRYPVEYSIFQVLSYFRTYVGESKRIDNLILVHKYTCDIWKNGSKHLYFYTLHNQEHAIDLISNSIKILRSIDYIDISRTDYYILFVACYLHDISMVTFPHLEAIQDDCFESNQISSDFRAEIEKLGQTPSEKSLKNMLKDYYLRLDEFYEGLVRRNHAKDSADEIRSRTELEFIDASLREIIAEISEAHGYNTTDIYNMKSVAKSHSWSAKYSKIVLRLADLLDMSNYRVSKVVLDHNLNNMGATSRFHWLSHLVTAGYRINVKYEIITNKNFLKKESIKEIIQIDVDVNLPQFTKVLFRNCKNMNLVQVKENTLEIKCGEECKSTKCNFLCAWFAKKNGYLFSELNALSNYLNSVPNNYFRTEIRVVINTKEKSMLSAEQFGVLSQYLENEN